MKSFLHLVFAATFFLSAVPLADALPTSPFVRDGSLFSLIDSAQREGVVTHHEARMQRFYGVFHPELLGPQWADAPRDDAPSCATALLADLRAHWDELEPSERHLVEFASSPLYRMWLEQGGISWEQGDVYAAQEEERQTCMSPSEAFSQGGPYEHSEESEYFSIRYNLSSDVSHAKIDDLSEHFAESLDIEHNQMGFYLPNGLLNYQMLVMIEQLPSESTGGFTSYAPCGLSGYMAFVVINSQWFDDNERLKSVAAHEFFHGIQIEYAAQEMWSNQESHNRWWIEASAVYMETEVYPTLYNSQASQAFRWLMEPHRSLETHDNSGYQYGTYLLAASIREGLDDSLWFNELWDQIFGRSGYDLTEEFDELFADYDSSFEEQWGRFIEVAATGEWDFNSYLPGVGELEELGWGNLGNSTIAEHDEDDYPVSESINSSSGLDRPEYLGVNYVYFSGEGLDDDLGLIIRFDGTGEKSGTELTWEVRLVAERNGNSKLTHDMILEMEREDDGTLERWTGQVLLNDFGEDFDGVYLIASPTADFGSGGVTWGYEAEITHSRADGSFHDTWEEDTGIGNGDDDDNRTGCACDVRAKQSGEGAFFLLLAGLFLGLRRRESL